MKPSLKRMLITLLLVAALVSVFTFEALADEDAICNPEDYKYTTADGAATVTKYTGTDSITRIEGRIFLRIAPAWDSCPLFILNDFSRKI